MAWLLFLRSTLLKQIPIMKMCYPFRMEAGKTQSVCNVWSIASAKAKRSTRQWTKRVKRSSARSSYWMTRQFPRRERRWKTWQSLLWIEKFDLKGRGEMEIRIESQEADVIEIRCKRTKVYNIFRNKRARGKT